MATYKGKLSKLKNPHKYVGNHANITYRSGWERSVMMWADNNEQVVEWASEEIIIPYDNPVTGKRARYYPDFYFKFSDGTTKVVEVKPKKETVAPDPSRKKTKRFITEQLTFAVNMEKWTAASEQCMKHSLIFEVWTEDTLKDAGILKWDVDKGVKQQERKRMRPSIKPNNLMKKRRRNPKRPGPPTRRS